MRGPVSSTRSCDAKSSIEDALRNTSVLRSCEAESVIIEAASDEGCEGQRCTVAVPKRLQAAVAMQAIATGPPRSSSDVSVLLWVVPRSRVDA